jgi:hypothetical protein
MTGRKARDQGSLIYQYKAGSRASECVEAYRQFMRAYMRQRRLQKRWEAAAAAAGVPAGDRA